MFENTHVSRLFSRISTFFENVNYFRKSELISKKFTFVEKVDFFEKFNYFRKSKIFLSCGTQFVTIKARHRYTCVKRILRTKLNAIKPTNTPKRMSS